MGWKIFRVRSTLTDNKDDDDLKMPDFDEDTKAKITGKSNY